MKRYIGTRTEEGCRIDVEDESGRRPLDPRLDLRRHSLDGYEWNYSGAGPGQTALALLADALGDDRAMASYMRFKFRVVGRLPKEGWEISQEEIERVVARIEAERGRGRA